MECWWSMLNTMRLRGLVVMAVERFQQCFVLALGLQQIDKTQAFVCAAVVEF